jgi:hypothetical protein
VRGPELRSHRGREQRRRARRNPRQCRPWHLRGAGVKLLGKGAELTSVGRVELAAGSDGLVRGVTVTAGGITVSGQNATIDAVRIADATIDGLTLAPGASATVSRSEISGSGRYAARAFDAASLQLDATVISGGNGPGLWAQCADGCDCTSDFTVTVSSTVIRNTKVVGMSLVGVTATLDNVEISAGSVDSGFRPGGGLSVSGCSMLDASGVRVIDNTHFGILVDDSSAHFRLTADGVGLVVSNNLRGIWAQNIGLSGQQSLTVDGATVTNNIGIGIGVDGQSLGATLTNCTVRDTTMTALPVLVRGVSAEAENVGDGLNWLGTSQMTVDGLTVSGSARASVLIDGPVAPGSSLARVTLEGNDVALGILQQNLAQGDTQPQIGAATPALTTSASELLSIPVPLGIPPEI